MKIYFQLFLISTFTLRSHGLATVSPIGEAALQVVLHTLLSRLFVPVPNTHPRLSDCFHATVPLSAYVGFKCHFSASAHPVVWFAVCQMPPVTSDFSVSLGEGAGFEPAMSYALHRRPWRFIRLLSTTQPTFLSSFYIFSKFYLNNFMSSYNPSAMFFAI